MTVPGPGGGAGPARPVACVVLPLPRRAGIDEGGPAWSVSRVPAVAGETADELRARAIVEAGAASTGAPGADVVVVPPPLASAAPGLVVTDVDSTLITSEVIEELAAFAGARDEVARVTASAMNGEIDFEESLRRRVAALAGVPDTAFAQVLGRIRPTPGAGALIEAVHAAGGAFGVVSGGFEEVVGSLAARMGIDHRVANRLEVSGGALTGRVLGEVVTADVKVRELRRWAGAHGVPMARTVAIGDGANDVPMMRAAGLGIAFCAKPSVRAQIPDALSRPDLSPVAEILFPRP